MLFYPNLGLIGKKSQKSKIQQEPGTATRGLGTGCQGSGYSNPRHIRRLFFREGRPEMKQKLSTYPVIQPVGDTQTRFCVAIRMLGQSSRQ